MHTPVTDTQAADGGVGGAAKTVAEHASAIARLEVELAALELKKKVAALSVGLGMGAGAALVAVYAIGFLFATIAAGFATFLATWLALLLMTVLLLLVAGALGWLALRSIKKGTPPVPEQAIQEAKLTSSALKR
jgi:uncharacterized membrane protein YqjE